MALIHCKVMYKHIVRRKYSLFQMLLGFAFIVTFWEIGKLTGYHEHSKTYMPVDDLDNYSKRGYVTKQEDGIKNRSLQIDKELSNDPGDSGREKIDELDTLLRHMLEVHPPPLHHRFNFNITHSQGISVNRDMPDIRSEHCKDIHYDIKTLPKVSIISPFYNEDLTVLLRHIHSVLRHSPRDLLREIILVDDVSTLPYLGTDLDKYLRILDARIKVIRNKKREGLSRTRIIGAKAAKEEVIIFLDSHMEFNDGWLEPIVARLAKQSKLVVQPHVVTIQGMENGQPEPVMRSSFGWDLRMAMYFIPPYLEQTITSPDHPIPTPGLVGCAIAVKRNYFFESGAFDPHLELWGAEHFELSFRTWMCGGRVEIVPCSKVAHLFRRPPYLQTKEAMEIVTKNIFRVAEIWMDDYKNIVFAALKGCCQNNLNLPVFREDDKLEEHKMMRRPSHCKNFDWFLSHVMPEARIPSKDAVYFGEVINVNTSFGLTVTRGNRLAITMNKLVRAVSIPGLYFTIDKHGRFMHMGKCVYFDTSSQMLKLSQDKCYGSTHNYAWSLDPGNGGRIVYIEHGRRLCLEHALNLSRLSGSNGVVLLKPCDLQNEAQLWKFPFQFDWSS